MLNKFSFSALTLATLAASQYSQATTLSDTATKLQQGLHWTVALQQYDVNSPEATPSRSQVLNYRVMAPAMVDGQPAWQIQVDVKDKTVMSAIVRRSDRQLLQVTVNGRTVDYATEQNNSAILSEVGYIPFDMPAFKQTAQHKTHRYVPVLSDWGFDVAVTQQQYIDDKGQINVTLKTRSRQVNQVWQPNMPWWQSSEQPGVYKATLLDIHLPDKSLSAAKPVFLSRDLKQPQSWQYPKTAAVSLKSNATARTSHHHAVNTIEGPQNAVADKQLWSGSWWQTSAWHGTATPVTRTWADGGLLEKYEQYAKLHGGRSGAKRWETDHANSFFMEAWHGHCNGWAAASLMFDEPKHSKTIDGIHFSIADQKGLLTELAFGVGIDYYLGPTYRRSSDNPLEPAPYDVHRAIVEHMGIHKRAMILDLDNNRELWNYPFYRYQITESAADNDRVRVTLKLWYAQATANNPNYVGLQDRTVTYRYYLSTDGNGNIIDGPSEWIAASNPNQTNPDYLWIPSMEAPSGYRRSHNPYLDADLIAQIVEAPFSAALSVGETVDDELESNGQHQWYHFDVVENGDYRIETELDSLADSMLYLYEDADGEAIAQNDDISSSNRASRIVRTLSPGRYYIKVKAYSSRQTGSYRLSLQRQ